MMRQSGETFQSGAYFHSKLVAAGENKDQLVRVISKMPQLVYERGTRKGDIALREKVSVLSNDLDQFYKMIRIFSSGKGGDTEAFPDIIFFFDDNYLMDFPMKKHLEALIEEIAQQEKLDHDHNMRYKDKGYVRRVNLYVRELEKTVKEWEKVLAFHFEPELRKFLTDINEIVLYHRINEKISRLIVGEDVFSRSGIVYQEFKNLIGYYVKIYIQLTMVSLNDAEIRELINRVLQQMGFRSLILRMRNINKDIFNEILTEIILEGKLIELSKKFSAVPRAAIDAIREKAIKSETDTRGLVRLVEELCYIEDERRLRPLDPSTAITGLGKKERERYLFHTPGTFEISLKFVAEYLRNSLIFVFDWLNKELKKNPGAAALLRPMMDCLPAVNEFILEYERALEVASNPSNQTSASVLSKQRQFITTDMARDLIKIIKNNITTVRHSLVDVSYNVSGSVMERSGALPKKIEILQDACNESYIKISNGLAEIEKI